MNKNEIIEHIYQLPIYDQVITKYFEKDSDDWQEFKQFIILELLEMDDKRIEKAWNEKYFLYLFVSIVKNNVASNTSRYHKQYRKHKPEELKDFNSQAENLIEEKENMEEKNNKLRKIYKAIAYHLNRDPYLKVDFDLFKMKFIDGLTYREIETITRTSLTSVYHHVGHAQVLIQGYILNNKK